METILVCIIAGMGAGLGTGFAGMSAAVVISPMLVTFLGINAFEAIGTALASDVLASAVSAYTYARHKNIDLVRSRSLFVSVLTFTLIGAFISHQVPAVTMGSLTVYMTLIMGINFFKKSFRDEEAKTPRQFEGKLGVALPILCGALIGFICGFIGAGGGIMMLILLTSVLGYELKTAVGTSVFIMTFTALFGATSHFTLQGSIPAPTIFFTCVISTLVFARLGARFANRSTPKVLNRAMGIVLSTIGIVMIVANHL